MKYCIFLVFFLNWEQALSETQFQNECVSWHNYYRNPFHGAPRLAHNQALCRNAQNWAKKVVEDTSRNMPLTHSGDKGVGENIYAANGKDVKCKDAVNLWYNECSSYKYNNPGFSAKTGHFTQVVWVNTKSMCCEKAVKYVNKVEYTVVVCQYTPQGNFGFQNDYEKNVLKPANMNCVPIKK